MTALTPIVEAIDVFLRTSCHAQEYNGYLYILCPACQKGHIVLKKCGEPFIVACEKTRHYLNERELITHLDDVHKVSSKNP